MNDAFIKLGISGCELGLSPAAHGRLVGRLELMTEDDFIDAQGRASAWSRVTADEAMEAAARSADRADAGHLAAWLRKTKATLNLALKLNDLDAVIDLEEHTARLHAERRFRGGAAGS